MFLSEFNKFADVNLAIIVEIVNSAGICSQRKYQGRFEYYMCCYSIYLDSFAAFKSGIEEGTGRKQCHPKQFAACIESSRMHS